ncbi:hypothetical protein L596_012844 [Steinernema carpocapsae]|uniref:Uncharacterized protein n=1 Tax=Steinernema carpocapsae TaxID=34508 RepID=A0A4V6A502_STECR|nr:hypothetical protein L596_012844 [Steinernema carpocapsae]
MMTQIKQSNRSFKPATRKHVQAYIFLFDADTINDQRPDVSGIEYAVATCVILFQIGKLGPTAALAVDDHQPWADRLATPAGSSITSRDSRMTKIPCRGEDEVQMGGLERLF